METGDQEIEMQVAERLQNAVNRSSGITVHNENLSLFYADTPRKPVIEAMVQLRRQLPPEEHSLSNLFLFLTRRE